jgi:hypothetical protein
MTTINNEWITLMHTVDEQLVEHKRNGVVVQRKFGGLDTRISEDDNSVMYCKVFYWERELYPNGNTIKSELKHYTLTDLPLTEVLENGNLYEMLALPVLTGFVNNLGYPGIINPARETLENTAVLPIDAPEGYPLRRDTREKILKVE